ncbi:hypothetical protein MPTK2_1g00350 [Marchantia polymorpha subsp. ruderalis]
MAGPRKRSNEALNPKSANHGIPSGLEKEGRADISEFEVYPELKSDIDNILAALQQVQQRTISDGQKKSEELLDSTAGEIMSMIQQAKENMETERETLSKQTSKLCKEYDAALKAEATKYKAAYAAFCEAKDSHLQAYEDIFAKFEDCKEQLLSKFDQLRKKEKGAYANLQQICTQKFDQAEQSIKKMKQEERSFQMLKKSLGTILVGSSDDEADDTVYG